MPRHNYKTALRAKGIKPIPPYHKLRTRKDGDGEQVDIVTVICSVPAKVTLLKTPYGMSVLKRIVS